MRRAVSLIRSTLSYGLAESAATGWWYVFPQISGLGSSVTARKFAISSLAEAVAYHDHPILGPRLRNCTELVNMIEGSSIEEIFGYPDHLKFHSSMTLFARAAPDEPVFQAALDKFSGGKLDKLTHSSVTR
jgi:uncharacterized protein (DUF1810 family)